MEKQHYRIRLVNNEEIGPLSYQEIRKLIVDNEITGNELVQIDDSFDWIPLKLYPELKTILDLKLSKIEKEEKEKTLQIEIKPKYKKPEEPIRPKKQEPEPEPFTNHFQPTQDSYTAPFNPIANEKTAMFQIPGQENESKKPNLKAKIYIALGIILALLILLKPDESTKTKVERFLVKMPTPAQVPDPIESEKIYQEALKHFVLDTVEGYKKSAAILLKSTELDMSNVKALSLLASSYLNLMDVVNRDEEYFNTVVKIIEIARSKGLDLIQMVMADVDLYIALGNPDAAIERISDFTKTHQYGAELYLYLSMSFYAKQDYENAFKYLSMISKNEWFSSKIPYYFGMLYKHDKKPDQAKLAFEEVVRRSPAHIKARVELLPLLYSADQSEPLQRHINFIKSHSQNASKKELAQSYYYQARLYETKQDEDSIKSAIDALDIALKLQPDESDYQMEYYTLKARMGVINGDAANRAKMYEKLALGEQALKDGLLTQAQMNFLSARQFQEKDPVPLIKLGDTFKLKGDLMSAINNYQKAVKLNTEKADYYPKLINALIEGYEFKEARAKIDIYKSLKNATQNKLDRMTGELMFKQSRLIEAQAYIKRALGDAASDPSIYITYADIMFAGRSFRDAAFYYGLNLRFVPHNPKAIIGVSKALVEMETPQKGIDYIRSAIDKAKDKAELLNGLAEILVQKGDPTQGLKITDQALEANREFVKTFKTRGDAYVALEKTRLALDAYTTYANLNPLDPAGNVEQYKIYLKKMDLKSAKEKIEKVIKDFPKYPGAYYMLADVYFHGQNYNGAQEAIKQELVSNVFYIPAYVMAAKIYHINKEYQLALDSVNRAIKLNPNYVPALLLAGDINRMLKTFGASKSLLERALTLDQGNPEVHKKLGALYLEMGDRPKGLQHFRAYIDLYPDAPDRAEIEQNLQR